MTHRRRSSHVVLTLSVIAAATVVIASPAQSASPGSASLPTTLVPDLLGRRVPVALVEVRADSRAVGRQ